MTHTNAETLRYKQSDERPAISSTLHDESGNAVDLTNAQSVTFILQAKDEFENDTSTLALNASASIVSATDGTVEYVLQDGDLDVAPGRYYGAWRVSWPDSGGDGVADDQWFPRDGLLQIDVERTPTGTVDPASAPADLTVTRLTASEIAGSVAGGNVISSLVGNNLSVDANGQLNAEAGGAFVDTDSDGDAELQTTNADFEGGDAKNVGALDADELSSEHLPAPGNVQSALDAASSAGGGKVSLRPEASYDAQNWTVPSGVTLDFNGAVVEPTTDTPVIGLVEPSGNVVMNGGGVDVRGQTYTSEVVTVDSTAAGDHYAEDDGNDVQVEIRVLDDLGGGAVALNLVADGSVTGGGQHYGCRYDVFLTGGDTGIRADIPNDSFINSCTTNLQATDCRVGIKQTASAGTAGDFVSPVYGEFQPDLSGSNASAYAVNNTTSARGPMIYGHVWDSHGYTQTGLDGDVNLVGNVQFPKTGANFSGTMVRYINGEVQFSDGSTTVAYHPNNGEVDVKIDGVGDFTLRGSGSFANADFIYNDIGAGPVLRSPDGTRWRIVVDDTGALSTEAF